MLMDRIHETLIRQLNELIDFKKVNEKALDSIFDFSNTYFSISGEYIYENNSMIHECYDKVSVDGAFLDAANKIYNMENSPDVEKIKIPNHAYADDLEADRAYMMAKMLIDSFMSGGHFKTSTFKTLIINVKYSLNEMPEKSLGQITFLEFIEYCAQKLQAFGINSRDWRFLANEWKDTAAWLSPQNDREREYLREKPYLQDPKYMKKMI